MALKRKRSVPYLGEPISPASSTLSSPTGGMPFFHAHPSTFHHMNSPHLHSRTLKRFRDNRPSEDQIHRRTLDLLYSEQRHEESDASLQQLSPPPADKGRQLSLHSFWNIRSSSSSAASTLATTAQLIAATAACQGCGTALVGGEDGAESMNTDGESTACGACGSTSASIAP